MINWDVVLGMRERLGLHWIPRREELARQLVKQNDVGLGEAREGADRILVSLTSNSPPYLWRRGPLGACLGASLELPLSWVNERQVWPQVQGAWWFEGPLIINAMALIGITWAFTSVDSTLGPGENRVTELSELDEGRFPFKGSSVTFWGDADYMPVPVVAVDLVLEKPLSEILVEVGDEGDEEKPLIDAWVRLLATQLSFLKQKLVSSHPAEPPRSARRRLARFAKDPESLSRINVVDLRQVETHRNGDVNGGPIAWSRRWIVRGHWRDQWYPSVKGHRPKWVLPYIKGPEDKPLLQPERVFNVVR